MILKIKCDGFWRFIGNIDKISVLNCIVKEYRDRGSYDNVLLEYIAESIDREYSIKISNMHSKSKVFPIKLNVAICDKNDKSEEIFVYDKAYLLNDDGKTIERI